MDNELHSALWKHYLDGVAYQRSIGLTEQIPKNVDFYEGRQWPKPTELTRNMPRPVVNIVKMIVRNKKATVTGGKVRLIFDAERDKERSERMTAFNAYIEREMGMESLRSRMAKDAIIKGSGFLHYYWDAGAKGAAGSYLGGVRAEVIDPLSIFFANPTETDEQKQKWILIATRAELSAVLAMADNSCDKSLIAPDEAENRFYDEKEQSGSELCTVLTRYFRRGGEVYYERATKSVMLHKPVALTPRLAGVETAAEDPVEPELPDRAERGAPKERASLYPIVAYNYELREKSIYGMSEVEEIISNQKSINFNLGMQLLSVQNQAWGKYVVKKDALKGQQITNAPGQVLTDYSPTGDGIRKLAEQPFSSMPLQLVDTLVSVTRSVTGSTEVMTGEQLKSGQSGAAIGLLQAQALQPVTELKDRYFRACERSGKVVEQFYKLFYEDKPFTRKTGEETVDDLFSGEEFVGTDFSVNVEAGAGTQYSEALEMATLSDLLKNGLIDFPTYVELCPDSAMPFKARLKKRLAAQAQSEAEQLRAELESKAQEIEQLRAQSAGLTEYIKNGEALVAKAAAVVAQFDALRGQLAALKVEGAAKILAQNAALTQAAQAADEATADARTLAGLLAENGALTDTVQTGNNAAETPVI